jgi:hypothetical protein
VAVGVCLVEPGFVMAMLCMAGESQEKMKEVIV